MLLYILYLKVYIVYILMARPPILCIPSPRAFFHATDSSVPSFNRSMLGLVHSPKMIVT